LDEIPYEIIETQSEKELKMLAYQKNSHHGLQLKNEEKEKYAQEMYGQMTNQALAELLSIDVRTIERWTKSQAEAAKKERDRKICELYLKAWNTQQSISEIFGLTQPEITSIINNIKKRQLSFFYNLNGDNDKPFKSLIYNIRIRSVSSG